MTWAVTGNNLIIKGDLATRFLICQMDAQVERPEERTFKRNLDQYVQDHRAELVTNGLTILRAHFLATDKTQLTAPVPLRSGLHTWGIQSPAKTWPCAWRCSNSAAKPISTSRTTCWTPPGILVLLRIWRMGCEDHHRHQGAVPLQLRAATV